VSSSAPLVTCGRVAAGVALRGRAPAGAHATGGVFSGSAARWGWSTLSGGHAAAGARALEVLAGGRPSKTNLATSSELVGRRGRARLLGKFQHSGHRRLAPVRARACRHLSRCRISTGSRVPTDDTITAPFLAKLEGGAALRAGTGRGPLAMSANSGAGRLPAQPRGAHRGPTPCNIYIKPGQLPAPPPVRSKKAAC